MEKSGEKPFNNVFLNFLQACMEIIDCNFYWTLQIYKLNNKQGLQIDLQAFILLAECNFVYSVLMSTSFKVCRKEFFSNFDSHFL